MMYETLKLETAARGVATLTLAPCSTRKRMFSTCPASVSSVSPSLSAALMSAPPSTLTNTVLALPL